MSDGASTSVESVARSGGAIVGYMDAQVDKLRLLIPRAMREGDVEAIHESRVATRRLKAAFDLIKPVLPERHLSKFNRTLRKLRRRLGPLRDLDVMREHLGELRSAGRHIEPIDWLELRLTESRVHLAEEALRDTPPSEVLGKLGRWWGVREEIVRVSEAAGTLLRRSVEMQFTEFSRRADELIRGQADSPTGLPSAEKRADGQPAGHQDRDDVDPHSIRIAGKALRYTLELARAEGHSPPDDVFKTFKKMQDALGLWHDYVVLTERALSVASAVQLAHHDSAAQRQILGLAQSTLENAELSLDHFARLWREKGDELERAVRSLFAELPASMGGPPVIAPKTDHGLHGSAESSAR